MKTTILICSLMIFTVLSGCQDSIVSPDTEAPAIEAAANGPKASKAGAQLGGKIWADDALYRTVGTPTQFHPGQGKFDALFTGSFKDGIGAISEAKPGDQDYNGGRWAVYALKAGVTTDYSNASSVDDLNMHDFELAGVYFECPLLPYNGK